MTKPRQDHPWNRRIVMHQSNPEITKMIREGRRVRSISDDLRDHEIAKALSDSDRVISRELEGFEALGASDSSHVSIGNGGYQRKAHRYG